MGTTIATDLLDVGKSVSFFGEHGKYWWNLISEQVSTRSFAEQI
jgi:hypothetical protein